MTLTGTEDRRKSSTERRPQHEMNVGGAPPVEAR